MTRAKRFSVQLLVLVSWLVVNSCQPKQVVAGFPAEFVGVGLELRIEGRYPVVIQALVGGSAEQAGIEPGDVLELIDGVSTLGLSLGDVVMRIRGAPDSQVSLGLKRGDQKFIVVLKRAAMSKTGENYRPKK